jgi:RNA polymerase sigma-70 factor (ECF subfamily)
MSPEGPAFDEILSASWHASELPSGQLSLALLRRAQEGDRTALHELLDRYGERLRRIVSIQLRSSPLRRLHDSMDIVQETFLAALPKVGELRPKSAASLLDWLAVIATNRIRDAFDHLTAQKRDSRRDVPLAEAPEARDVGNRQVDEASDPSRAAEMREICELVDAEVAALPHDQRRVVLLRDYCGESWERIAEELERESGAARQLHQRAWIRLRRALRPRLDAPSNGDRAFADEHS